VEIERTKCEVAVATCTGKLSTTMEKRHVDDPAADPEDAREDPDEKADDHTLPGVHVVDVSRAARVHDPPGAGPAPRAPR